MEVIYTLLLEYNLCKVFFIVSIFLITFFGMLINFVENSPLPHFILQIYKFGKMAHNVSLNKFVSLLEVPKRWFYHFYIFASIIASVSMLEVWGVYTSGRPLSHWLVQTLNFLTTPHRTSAVSETSAILALGLFTLHLYRRLYECLFVSVFSATQMNAFHYLLAFGHYLSAVALLLAELPSSPIRDSKIGLTTIEAHHLVGTLLCLSSFVVQHHTFRLLANLRKKQGTKRKDTHVLPEGGLFCIVSCPHMLSEILVYVGVLVVLEAHHNGWALVTLWVLTNQVQIALLHHKWYCDTFKDYPRERKAIIPYLL